MAFWRVVIIRALQETLQLLGMGNLRRIPITLAAFITAILVLRFIPGGAVQVAEEVRWTLAVALAAAILFLPIFGSKLISVPSAIHSEQKRALASLRSDDINMLVDALEADWLIIKDGTSKEGDKETYDWILSEIAEDLATTGVTIPESGRYHGLLPRQLRGFFAQMTYYGIVEARRRTIERDRGYPYTETDYFLTPRGAEVIARLRKKWNEMYPED